VKSKVILALLALIYLICSISAVSAGKETQLTYGQRSVIGTAVYGNIVTWSEIATDGVHVYDLTSGKEIGAPEFKGEGTHVYGDKVVWTDRGNRGNGILMFDAYNCKETQISPEGYSPDIYENHIVYIKNSGVYLYDLNTRKETRIASAANNTFYNTPAIYNNKVVWLEESGLYIYDIPSHCKSIITSKDGVSSPDIYGNDVVWQEYHNGKNDIYMHDIAKHETTQITKTGTAIFPIIYGNGIVWQSSDAANGKWIGDIYLYEISTGKTLRITYSTCAYLPSIHGDEIVYADAREGKGDNDKASDIYLYDLAVNPTLSLSEKVLYLNNTE